MTEAGAPALGKRTDQDLSEREGPAMASTTSGTSATPRFLQLADVAEILNTSAAQVYSLVRSGELPAIKIGGRGQWRVEASELEKYIERMYELTRDFVSTHRFGRADDVETDGPAKDEAPE